MNSEPSPSCQGYQADSADPDDQSITDKIGIASDLEWHLNPAHPHLFCGGCGNEAAACHDGQCCTDVPDELGVISGVCDLCPTRYETGQVKTRGVRFP